MSDAPARSSLKHAPPEEVSQVDAALEATKGNRNQAAEALGIDVKRIYNLIKNNAYLHAKWSMAGDKPAEPTPASDLHRPPPPVTAIFTSTDKEIVVAITKEDAVLQKGWQRLGFDTKERKFLAGLQATYAGNLKSTLELSYGGAAHANTRLLLALEDVRKKLDDITANPDKYQRSYMTEHGERISKGPDEYLKEFYDVFIKISSELRKMGDSVTRANELRLRMEKLRMTRGSQSKTEAGWESAKPVNKKEGGE